MGKYKRTKKGVNIQLDVNIIDRLNKVGIQKKWPQSQVFRELIKLALEKKLDKEL